MQRIKVDKITPTRSSIVDQTSAVIVVANQYRRYLLIQNQDPSNIVYIEFEQAAIVGSLAIGPGKPYLVDAQIMHSAIHAICDTSLTAQIYILEGQSGPYFGP